MQFNTDLDGKKLTVVEPDPKSLVGTSEILGSL